jgi:acyl carrier protein
MTTTFDRICAMITRDFELPPERLQRDTLLEEIELDSLAITELVFEIEDEFKITAENTIPAFKTLGDIADYVARLVAERDAKPSPAPKRAAAKAKRTSATKPRAAAANGSRVAKPAAGANGSPGAKPAAVAKRRTPRAPTGDTQSGKRKRSSARGGARAR